MTIGRIPSVEGGIQPTIFDAAGDLLYASAADTPARLAIGSTDQVLKVSGGIPAWGAAPSPTFVGASAKKTSNQSIATGTYTIITFDSEDFDTDAFHSTVTNTGRMTIPSGKGGKYLLSGLLAFDAGTSYRVAEVYKNGANFTNFQGPAVSGDATTIAFNLVMDLVATDYIEIRAWQGTAGNLNVLGSGLNSRLQVTYLGA